MPIIKSAIKKLRKDIKREKQNDDKRSALRKIIRTVEKNATVEAFQKAVSSIDKAAKNKLIHKNKAARIKSSLSKLVAKPAGETTAASKKVASKAPKKPTVKKKAAK